jgi:hypothetical protein
MSLTKVSYSMISGTSVNVLDFGADPTGATDSTAAIQDAIDACNALTVTGTGGVTGTGSQPFLFFPAGKFRISSTLTTGAYLTMEGNRSILQIDAGVIALQSTGYQVIIRGMVFLGGAQAIAIATSNIDTSTVSIYDCEFQNQTSMTFGTSTTSNSTQIRIERCKILNLNTGCIIGNFLSGDGIHLNDNWISTNSDKAFVLGGATGPGGTMICVGNLGVPYASTGVWFTLSAQSSLSLRSNRFGGESGGFLSIVDTYQTAADQSTTFLVMDDNSTFSSGAVVRFFGIPRTTILTNNTGQTFANVGIVYDAAITDAMRQAINGANCLWNVENNSWLNDNILGSGDILTPQYVYALDNTNVGQGTTQTSDKVLQIPFNSGSFGLSTSSTGVTQTSTTNTFGAFAQRVAVNTDPNNFIRNFTTAMNGFANALYTAVFEITNEVGYPLRVTFNTSTNGASKVLMRGRNIICVPFFFDSTASQNIGLGFNNVQTGSQFTVGSIRVFAGNVDIETQNTVVYGTAVPTTLQWEVGDRVVNSTPTVGQPKAWVCTVAGGPGTWVSEGNL